MIIMYKSFKNAIISVILCSTLVLWNQDLSSFNSYLNTVYLRIAKARESKQECKEQKYVVVLPNHAVLIAKRDVYSSMGTYTKEQILQIENNDTTICNLNVLSNTLCRGSPFIRSP